MLKMKIDPAMSVKTQGSMTNCHPIDRKIQLIADEIQENCGEKAACRRYLQAIREQNVLLGATALQAVRQ